MTVKMVRIKFLSFIPEKQRPENSVEWRSRGSQRECALISPSYPLLEKVIEIGIFSNNASLFFAMDSSQSPRKVDLDV